MSLIKKRVRHYYWIITAFTRKNIKFLLVSSVSGFFIILVLLKISPYINTIVFMKKEVIGIVGQYSLKNIPLEISQLISNPLITIDSDGEIKPVLAHSWEILNDGKLYRLYLKDNLYWNDKKKFSTKDISYNLKDVEVAKRDDYILDFKLNQPLAIFPIYLTKPILKYPLVGVGSSYTVQSYKIKKNILQSINLSPNTENLPLKIYRFYQTDDDAITAYKKGNINIFKTQNRNVADVFSSWKNSEIIRNVDYGQVMTLFMNNESGILQERDLRKALAYAAPVFDEYGMKAKGPIPPISWAYDPELKEYMKNDERSRTLLEKNITSSDSAKLNLITFFEYADIAEVLKKNFEDVGLDINIKIVSYIPQEYDLLLTVWNPPTDPDQYFFWHSTQESTNITRIKNVKIDKLLEDGRTVTNVKQRKNIYKDFQKTIIDESPALFLFHPYVYTIHRK